jgi:hypothetical protein
MRNALLLVLLISMLGFSASKTVVKITVKPDTIMEIDTSYFVKYDTTKYTQNFKDTTVACKPDSTKVSSKPVKIQIKKVK